MIIARKSCSTRAHHFGLFELVSAHRRFHNSLRLSVWQRVLLKFRQDLVDGSKSWITSRSCKLCALGVGWLAGSGVYKVKAQRESGVETMNSKFVWKMLLALHSFLLEAQNRATQETFGRRFEWLPHLASQLAIPPINSIIGLIQEFTELYLVQLNQRLCKGTMHSR